MHVAARLKTCQSLGKANRTNSAEMPLQKIAHLPGKVWSIPGKVTFKPFSTDLSLYYPSKALHYDFLSNYPCFTCCIFSGKES